MLLAVAGGTVALGWLVWVYLVRNRILEKGKAGLVGFAVFIVSFLVVVGTGEYLASVQREKRAVEKKQDEEERRKPKEAIVIPWCDVERERIRKGKAPTETFSDICAVR